MTYRLPSERILLPIEGPSVEVERIAAWPLYWAALRLLTACLNATTPDERAVALARMYGAFELEAQPTWDLADHRGPIPATAAGMNRLDVAFALDLVAEWLDTHNRSEEVPEAVDEAVPPGELRDAIHAELKRKRNADHAE